MQVEGLEIRRNASYETPANALVGKVRLVGELGQVTVVLSNSALIQIFRIIKAECAEVARAQANQVSRAVENAVHEPALIEAEQNLLGDN